MGIVGEGVIDGRGGEPMLGSEQTWWDVAQHAKVKDIKHSNPRIIDVKKAERFTMYKISIVNSPKFHVMIMSAWYIVWGVRVVTPSRPTNSLGRPLNPHYARNTDGIDPSAASDGFIVYSYISVGDDQIAIKGGSGPINNLVIAHNRFGTGHGMSIGSETNEGVNNVSVYDSRHRRLHRLGRHAPQRSKRHSHQIGPEPRRQSDQHHLRRRLHPRRGESYPSEPPLQQGRWLGHSRLQRHLAQQRARAWGGESQASGDAHGLRRRAHARRLARQRGRRGQRRGEGGVCRGEDGSQSGELYGLGRPCGFSANGVTAKAPPNPCAGKFAP